MTERAVKKSYLCIFLRNEKWTCSTAYYHL